MPDFDLVPAREIWLTPVCAGLRQFDARPVSEVIPTTFSSRFDVFDANLGPVLRQSPFRTREICFTPVYAGLRQFDAGPLP